MQNLVLKTAILRKFTDETELMSTSSPLSEFAASDGEIQLPACLLFITHDADPLYSQLRRVIPVPARSSSSRRLRHLDSQRLNTRP